MAYDNTNRGTLGRNLKRAKDTHPEYSGKLNVDGVEYWVSGWVKDGPTGKFFSLAIKPKDEQAAAPAPAAPAGRFEEMDDDIPF
jgi:hypothetical protein